MRAAKGKEKNYINLSNIHPYKNNTNILAPNGSNSHHIWYSRKRY
jgi:hypothetical protein